MSWVPEGAEYHGPEPDDTRVFVTNRGIEFEFPFHHWGPAAVLTLLLEVDGLPETEEAS